MEGGLRGTVLKSLMSPVTPVFSFPCAPLDANSPSATLLFQNIFNLCESRLDIDAKRRRAPSTESIIFVEIDAFAWNLGHVESPEHTSDSQPDFALSNEHAWADTAPGEGDMCQLGCNEGGRGEGNGSA